MNKLIIAQEEFKRIISYNKNIVITFLFLLFFTFVPAFMFNKIIEELSLELLIPTDKLVNDLYKFYIFTFLLSCAMLVIYTVSMDTFLSDKKERALDALLSTPISLSDLWIGKSLALFALSYITCVLAALGFALILFVLFQSWPSDWATWIYLFTIFPIMSISLIALGGIGQLVSKRFVGVNMTLFFIGFTVMFISSFLVERLLTVNSLLLLGIFAAISLLIVLANYYSCKTYFTKERIILS